MKIISTEEPAFITPWTSVHLLFGIFYAAITKKTDLLSLIIIATIYEIKDLYFEEKYKSTLINSIGDVLAAILGFLMFYHFKMNWNHVLMLTLGTLLFLTSPLSSKDGTWTNDIWNSRG